MNHVDQSWSNPSIDSSRPRRSSASITVLGVLADLGLADGGNRRVATPVARARGPPNLYLRRLQEAAAAATSATQTEERTDEASASPVSTVPSPPSTVLSPSIGPKSPTAFREPSLSSSLPTTVPAVPIPPSRYPIAADTYHPHYPSTSHSSSSFNGPRSLEPTNGNGILSHTSPKSEEPQSYPSPQESFSTYPLYNWSYKQHQSLPAHPPNVIPSLSFYYRPHRLEDIAPRDTISLIIALFFDFVYPLTPCVHKPSFMADLHARREERDPLFFALVMSTVASTLVQVPRSYLPMERPVVRKLAQTCHEASRHISVASYDPPTSMHVVIRYFDCVYHFCEGHDATQHAAFGEAAHIAVTLRMHEEASYEGLDPIECEVRRRIFWLLFGADKSMSILLGRPICLRDEDCTVHFPKELDDEYITPSAYLPQPHGKTATVSGLNYISRLFALLGEILVRIRVDKRSPPQGQFATARLEEVQSLHTRIMAALIHAPEPLRLKQTHAQSRLPPEYGGAGFRQATFAEVKDFFDNPNASRANALNPSLSCKRICMLRSNSSASIDEMQVAEDREAVASDLLNILHSIPIQSIATNGPSLVHKVRFVASTLLDAVRKAETAPASAARAHAYLWDFLSILSEIERNYLLDDDRDGNSSGTDGMMIG
ncbi:putative fungal specific transcription factor [Lyophyllum shimeji]|uniref:Fungal specific transcription factor n=1 Tax=Lyophyllum shimeji TaxID=47721 RepID=A0A9P3PL05_LYOSH|nr:putative fungal specific transcription factor [Lyophyllum shimeji]